MVQTRFRLDQTRFRLVQTGSGVRRPETASKATRDYRESPSAAHATQSRRGVNSVQGDQRRRPRLPRKAAGASTASATRDGVQGDQRLQRVAKRRACHAKQLRHQRRPRRPETTESHQVDQRRRRSSERRGAVTVFECSSICQTCIWPKLLLSFLCFAVIDLFDLSHFCCSDGWMAFDFGSRVVGSSETHETVEV